MGFSVIICNMPLTPFLYEIYLKFKPVMLNGLTS